MRMLLAGNWKMNGGRAALAEIAALKDGAGKAAKADILICPPATLIMAAADAARGSSIRIGGQDCHAEPRGAFTGDISAEMLSDAGAVAVIVGHSERRQYHGETDAIVARKAGAARRAGLLALLCVGETEAERHQGRALSVVKRQLKAGIPAEFEAKALAIAYEPVWAIGTGRTPGPAEIGEMHSAIRAELIDRFGESGSTVRILYGGSVKPDNARDILAAADVNGALVGGASLRARDFLAIVDAC